MVKLQNLQLCSIGASMDITLVFDILKHRIIIDTRTGKHKIYTKIISSIKGQKVLL